MYLQCSYTQTHSLPLSPSAARKARDAQRKATNTALAYRGGGGGVKTPPTKIPKAPQNCAKHTPIGKTVKNY